MKNKNIQRKTMQETTILNKEDLEKVCGGIHIGIKVPDALPLRPLPLRPLPLRPDCGPAKPEILNKEDMEMGKVAIHI